RRRIVRTRPRPGERQIPGRNPTAPAGPIDLAPATDTVVDGNARAAGNNVEAMIAGTWTGTHVEIGGDPRVCGGQRRRGSEQRRGGSQRSGFRKSLQHAVFSSPEVPSPHKLTCRCLVPKAPSRGPGRTRSKPSDRKAGAAAAGGDRVGVPDLEGLTDQVVDEIDDRAAHVDKRNLVDQHCGPVALDCRVVL